MAIKDIFTLLGVLLGFVTSVLIPSVIVMINQVKKVRLTKTEAEKQAALSDLKNLARNFVVEAENLYKDIDAIVKQNGKTCGAVKKDSVMTKIQDACLTKSVDFDKEFWSQEVDDLVAATRSVNAKQ